MATAALNVVGSVLGVLGFAAFAGDFVKQLAEGNHVTSHLTLAIGQTAETAKFDPENMAGNIPSIRIFAADGRDIGKFNGNPKKTWTAGAKPPIEIVNQDGSQYVDASYVAVYGDFGTNAICISAIGLTTSTNEKYGWTGDVGVTCGMQWHWSNTTVGIVNGKKYNPGCVWITGMNSNNPIHTQGFSVKINDFSQISDALRAEYEDDVRTMCDSAPRFSAWTSIVSDISPPFFVPTIQEAEDGSDADRSKLWVPGLDRTDYRTVLVGDNNQPMHPVRLPFPPPSPAADKRSILPRSAEMKSTLISSAYEGHSARMLCESSQSFGPDVISESEGLFCDMDDKKLWPLCSEDVRRACFDITTNQIRGDSVRRAPVPKKSYRTVHKWGA
jgi:hypothetical protein